MLLHFCEFDTHKIRRCPFFDKCLKHFEYFLGDWEPLYLVILGLKQGSKFFHAPLVCVSIPAGFLFVGGKHTYWGLQSMHQALLCNTYIDRQLPAVVLHFQVASSPGRMVWQRTVQKSGQQLPELLV
jgi:hypothetical protein